MTPSAEPATSPGLLGPGTRLGRYQIIRRLATGGMAELYLARHVAAGGYQKVVALKRVQGATALSPDGRLVAYVVREANWDEDAFETEIFLGDTQSGVMPCPKIPVPCSHFLDCPNCWKGCDSVASFSDAKLTLFRKEIWEEGQSLVRRGLGMAGWGSCLGGIHGFDGCVGFIAGHAAR